MDASPLEVNHARPLSTVPLRYALRMALYRHMCPLSAGHNSYLMVMSECIDLEQQNDLISLKKRKLIMVLLVTYTE